MASESLQHCRQRLRASLQAAGIEEADLEAVLLIEAVTGFDRLRQLTAPDEPLTAAAMAKLQGMANERLTRRPLAQILGWCEFYGLRFTVNADVLCPRPETELLVDAVLGHVAGLPRGQHVADLGTGSGAIAVALASRRPDLHVVAIDRSPAALAVARHNGARLAVAIDWRPGDWTAALQAPEQDRFAAIVSNPPYIPEADWRLLEPEVRDHEPKGALVGGPDGLAPYRILPALVWPFLQPGGLFAVEIGIGQAADVQALFEQAGYGEVTVTADLAGIARVVQGYRPL